MKYQYTVMRGINICDKLAVMHLSDRVFFTCKLCRSGAVQVVYKDSTPEYSELLPTNVMVGVEVISKQRAKESIPLTFGYLCEPPKEKNKAM